MVFCWCTSSHSPLRFRYQLDTRSPARIAVLDAKKFVLKMDLETNVLLANLSWSSNPDYSLGAVCSVSHIPFRQRNPSQLVLLGLNGFVVFSSAAKLLYAKNMCSYDDMGSSTVAGDCVFALRRKYSEEHYSENLYPNKTCIDDSSPVEEMVSLDPLGISCNSWQPHQCYSSSQNALAAFIPPPTMISHDDEFIITATEILELGTEAKVARAPQGCVFVSGLQDGIVYFWRQSDGALGRLRLEQAQRQKQGKRRGDNKISSGAHEAATKGFHLGDEAPTLAMVTRYLVHVFVAGFSLSHSQLLGLPLIRNSEMAACCQLAVLQVALREFGPVNLSASALRILNPRCQDLLAFHNALEFIRNETKVFA